MKRTHRITAVRESASELPVFLMGHSMGGLIALDYVLRRPDGLLGTIISGLGLEPAGAAKPHLVVIAKLLSRIWPRLSLDVGLDIEAVSRNPAVVEAFRNDPLRNPRASVRWGTEILDAIAQQFEAAALFGVRSPSEATRRTLERIRLIHEWNS